MTTATKVRIRWAAARDQIAHGHTRGTGTRTLCGQPEVRDRDAWPTFRRCLACSHLAAELEAGR
jgi:hypothetical protein